jgi:peptidoglycan/LPS O-acetylase OafA/YrhL
MATRVYFPNLNGLRFIAALLVIIHHVEQIKSHFRLDNYWHVPGIYLIGKLGVILFFVLSGFLITYLLLTEEKKTGTISIKDFYIRRILRIWPLYYLIIISAFFIFSNIGFFYYPARTDSVDVNFVPKLFLYLFFLPNLATILFPPVPYLAQAWSVGVEEQFYLIWPVLIKKIKSRFNLLAGVIILYLVIKGMLYVIAAPGTSNLNNAAYSFWELFNIDCMAIGGLMALGLIKKHPVMNFIFNRTVQWFALAAIILLIGFGVTIPYLHYEIYGTLFAVMIVNLAANPNRIFSIETKTFDYLGKISYGIYMYHPFAVFVCLKVLMAAGLNNTLLQHLISISIAVVTSAVSYELFERYFIRRKLKFSKVVSGDNVKDASWSEMEQATPAGSKSISR